MYGDKRHCETRSAHSQEAKRLFKRALEIGGFRSLTDFVISAVAEKAEAIMEKHNNWLGAEKDRKIFFDVLINPPEPNDKLKQALRRHGEFNQKK